MLYCVRMPFGSLKKNNMFIGSNPTWKVWGNWPSSSCSATLTGPTYFLTPISWLFAASFTHTGDIWMIEKQGYISLYLFTYVFLLPLSYFLGHLIWLGLMVLYAWYLCLHNDTTVFHSKLSYFYFLNVNGVK